MKHFKVGALAVIAIAAMSFTVISTHKSHKGKKIDDGCYASVKITGNSVFATSSNASITTASAGNCFNFSVIDNVKIVNYPSTGSPDITSAQPIDAVGSAVDPVTCDGRAAFCCYEVVSNQVVGICYKKS